MMRMVGLVLLICGGTVAAIELGTPTSAKKGIEEPHAQTIPGMSDSWDTLTKADRLEISYRRDELPTQPISLDERIPSLGSTSMPPQESRKVVNRHPHNPNAKKIAVVLPKRRPKKIDSKRVTAADRPKSAMELKPCRPTPLDSLLKMLKLSPGCQT
jgi:hypothetical protein